MLFDVFFSARCQRDGSKVAVEVVSTFPKDTPAQAVRESTQFLFPEHIETFDSQLGSDRFFFTLSRDNNSVKQYGFVLRSFLKQTGGVVVCEVVAVLSTHCWPNVFFEALVWQARLAEQCGELFMHKLLQSPLPQPGGAYRVNLKQSPDPIVLPVPRTRYFFGEVSCKPLFEALPPHAIVQAVMGLLLERRIMIHSARLQQLSYAIHAMLSLLFPFRFEYTVVPIVPPHLVELCCATFPFVIGAHSSVMPAIRKLPLEEVITVDLDAGVFRTTFKPVVPPPQIRELEAQFSKAKSEHGFGTQAWNGAIQEAFLGTFASMFGHYRKFMGEAKDPKFFDKPGFCKESPKNCREFVTEFVETQVFSSFLQRRCELEREDDFDRRAASAVASSSGFGKTWSKFLETMEDLVRDDDGSGASYAPVRTESSPAKPKQTQQQQQQQQHQPRLVVPNRLSPSSSPRSPGLQPKKDTSPQKTPQVAPSPPPKDLLDFGMLSDAAFVSPVAAPSPAPAAPAATPSAIDLLSFDAFVASPAPSPAVATPAVSSLLFDAPLDQQQQPPPAPSAAAAAPIMSAAPNAADLLFLGQPQQPLPSFDSSFDFGKPPQMTQQQPNHANLLDF